MTDQFENFNRHVASLQSHKMIPKQELKDDFKAIHLLLQQGTRALLETTHFVEDNVCFRLAEVASGSMKKKIYLGRFSKDKKGVGQGVSIGAENSKLLGLGFDLFKLSRINRDMATPLVLRVLRSMRLQNMNYEHILKAFVHVTKDYRKLCEDLTVAQEKLRAAEDDGNENVVELMQKISVLIDQKQATESKAGAADPNFLYGTVSIVRHFVSRIERIQEKILASYQRSIPKIVREFAQSDLDAEDLLQVGRFGLLHAISAYDYRMSTSFSRFSKYWIRQRIQGYRKKSGGPMVPLSDVTWDNYRKIRKAEKEIHTEDNFEPTRQDVADHLGWAVEKVDITMEEIATVHLANIDDDVYCDNERFEREATIADTQEEDWKQAEMNAEQIAEVIGDLDPEDHRLICLRYGLVDHIQNDHLDKKEVFRELVRQLGCKTLLHRYLAGKMDTIQSLPVITQEED